MKKCENSFIKVLLYFAGALFIVCMSTQIFAAQKAKKIVRNYGMAGCGLGAVVMGKDGGQISAATTNGTFASQLLGISFGTLECIDEKNRDLFAFLDEYIHSNYLSLASDISHGQGETVNGLAKLLGCSKSEELQLVLKENFSGIYKNAQVDTMAVTDSIVHIIRSTPNLQDSCSKMI